MLSARRHRANPARRFLLVATFAFVASATFVTPAAFAARQTEQQLSSAGRYSYRYLLYLPPGFDLDPTFRWPLLVMLHGSGAVGTPLNVMSLAGPGLRIEQGHDFPAVVVSPQSNVYNWIPSELAAFIDDVVALYRIDRDRIYVTGMSMGGYGTWNLGTAYPERYAALVPVCGGGNPSLAPRLRDVPVWAFHGDADATVPVARSREMIDAIRAAGGEPRFTVYAGVGHDSWTRAYGDEAMYEWMFAQNLRQGPEITTEPAPVAVAAGGTARFSVAAHGGALNYQWRKDGVPIAGGGATLEIAGARAEDAGDYSVVVSNSRASTVSTAVVLTVRSEPRIIHGPLASIVAPGEPAIFQVAADGGDLGYEWSRDGQRVAGASGPTLVVPAVRDSDAGEYTVTVTNPRGRTQSGPARLSLAPADGAARIVNLSVRASAGVGDATLIAGLTVDAPDGTTGLPVLLRGVGPGLRLLGVEAPMIDPALVLFRRTTALAANGDWGGDELLTAASRRLGAYPLTADSRDAALQLTLPKGGYTMHAVSGLPGRAGIALLECYDASGNGAQGAPRLINVSARATVTASDGALMAGFVIAGTGTQRVLLRGLGPALATAGVNGALTDPRLRLFRRGEVIAENDNWGGTEELRAAFARVGAPELPAGAQDAALLVTLPAGIYSAHVNSADSTDGVGLIELFALP